MDEMSKLIVRDFLGPLGLEIIPAKGFHVTGLMSLGQNFAEVTFARHRDRRLKVVVRSRIYEGPIATQYFYLDHYVDGDYSDGRPHYIDDKWHNFLDLDKAVWTRMGHFWTGKHSSETKEKEGETPDLSGLFYAIKTWLEQFNVEASCET